MTTDKIDRILATEEEIIPSSGFLASVMERIEEEVAAPPPIPFPWKRAVPGIALVTSVLGWGGYELIRRGLPALGTMSMAMPHLPAAMQQPLEQLGWVALAMGLSLGTWVFSKAVGGRS